MRKKMKKKTKSTFFDLNTHYALKQKKANYAHMSSSILIAMKITRWTLICVHSGNIGSTKNGTTKSILRSVKQDKINSLSCK